MRWLLLVVDYDRAMGLMCQNFTETLLQETMGTTSARIYRILCRKKVLDEKGISKIGLMTPKEVREKLFKMAKAGFVEIQVRNAWYRYRKMQYKNKGVGIE